MSHCPRSHRCQEPWPPILSVERRLLGSTGISVSALGLGCEPLGGSDWGTVDIGAAMRTVREAWEHGITLFDTANVYGLGESERRLSLALGKNRHEATIVSKFGIRWSVGSGDRAGTWKDASPANLTISLEGTLRRLRIERIPVYLVHWPDGKTPIFDTVEALESHRRAGKIGVYGVSNFEGAELEAAAEQGVEVMELPLNLIQRRAEAALEFCRERRLGVIAYGAYAQGLLCGRYDRNSRFEKDDRRHRLPQFSPEAWMKNGPILDRLWAAAQSAGVPPSQVALRWVLDAPGVSSTVISAKNLIQLEEALGVFELDGSLDRDSFFV